VTSISQFYYLVPRGIGRLPYKLLNAVVFVLSMKHFPPIFLIQLLFCKVIQLGMLKFNLKFVVSVCQSITFVIANLFFRLGDVHSAIWPFLYARYDFETISQKMFASKFDFLIFFDTKEGCSQLGLTNSNPAPRKNKKKRIKNKFQIFRGGIFAALKPAV